MSETNSKIIQYYKSCYQADARDLQLMNFFGAKIEEERLLDDSDLISGKNILYPISTEWGKSIDTNLSIYGQEKGLYAFSLFLIGKYNVAGRNRKVMAPLIIHPLELQEIDEVYYLSIKEGHHIFNPFFFQLANTEGSSVEAKEEFHEKINHDFIHFDDCVFISDIVKKHFNNIDAEALLKYPDLLSTEELNEIKNKHKGNNYLLLPACGVGLMAKSFGNRGIHEEMDKLTKSPSYSSPIQHLFQTNKIKKEEKGKKEKRLVYSPVLLSHAQAEICRNATSENLSVIIGPPGTGKSFTIAAIACDALAHGKTVLLASKNNQAVDVVADKLENEMRISQLAIRAGRKDYLKKLKGEVEAVLYKMGGTHLVATTALENKLLKLNLEISALEEKIKKREINELNKGQFLVDKNKRLHYWRKKILKYKEKNKLLINDLFVEYYDLLKGRNHLLNNLLNRWILNAKRDVLKNDKNGLRIFHKALKSRNGTKREELFDQINLHNLLVAFPVWLVNFQDIHNVLPLQKELFDLVIIDEASQCDTASALPILQRGKHAVIVGDPKQLRHISFLSNFEQKNIRKKYELESFPKELLDYRNTSVLDLALESIQDNSQVQALSEHYRSQPDIISFSNEKFYNNNLKIMTACPAKEKQKNVFLHHVNGKKLKDGSNKEEADAILEQVLSIIEQDKDINNKLCHSIGILSPFRGQVDYIQKQVQEKLNLFDIEKHKILIGTPHSFQGEEKDVMFISFTIDKNTSGNVLRYIEKSDVFNVSITRAKNQQNIFISCQKKEIKHIGLLYQYIDSISQDLIETKTPEFKIKEEFMKEVVFELKKMKLEKILTHHQVASLDLDIVVVNKGKTKTIDLVGFPGAYQDIYHLEYYRLLSRMNIKVYPLSYSQWVFQKEIVLSSLRDFLKVQ